MNSSALSPAIPFAVSADPAGAATDGELMARVAAGDADAFEPIVERYQRRLFGYFLSLVDDPAAAADLAQDTFLRAYRAAGRYRDEGRFEAWLFRIAANLVRSDRRRAARRGPHVSLDAVSPGASESRGAAPALRDGGVDAAGAAPDVSAWRSEVRDALQRALPRVPLPFRQAVLLRDLEGWSYREIAEMLGVEEGTVKSRAHRGRQRLRALLAPAYQDASFEAAS